MRWRDVKQKRIDKNKKLHAEADVERPRYRYASLAERFKAFITDSFLLAMPIFYFVIYMIMNGREGFSHHMLLGWAYILIPLGIVVVAFYTISGQTPGLKAYDLKLIDVQSGQKPSPLLAALRFLYFNLILFTLIGLFFPYFRKDRRGIHDLLSGTAVIRLDSDG